MDGDNNGTSYAEMRTVTFSSSESVTSSHDVVGDSYAQLPVIMSDREGKEFMVHFADDHDLENMENIDEEVELSVGSDGLKMVYTRGDSAGDVDSEGRRTNPIPDQERFLPIANVARVMKRMIPSSGKIAKDAKECVQECVSEFISFITSEANDKCLSEKRKTISADDLLEAITNMGFDNYVAPLQLFLERYRAAHRLSNLFPSGNVTRSFSSEGCLPSQKGSPRNATAQEFSHQTSIASTPTTSSTTGTHRCTATTVSNNAHSGTMQAMSSSHGAPVVLAGGVGGMPVTALHQQPMQIYIDPASKQHYMAIETDQGMQLYPIQIQTDGPVAYTVTSEVATAMTSSCNSDSQAFFMMTAGEVENGHNSIASGVTTETSAGNSRSNLDRTHLQSRNEFGNRHQSRNNTLTTTYAATSGQDEDSLQVRPNVKRQSAGGKVAAGKAVASLKRPRHS